MKKKLFKKFLPLCLVLSLGLGFGATTLVNARPACPYSPDGEHYWEYKGGDINEHDIYQCRWCGVFKAS